MRLIIVFLIISTECISQFSTFGGITSTSDKVGIGLSNPTYILETKSNDSWIRNQGISRSGFWAQASSDAVLQFGIFDSGAVGSHFGVPNDGLAFFFTSTTNVTYPKNFVLGSWGPTNFLIGVNGAERLRVTTDGKVGIGTTSPESMLSINGKVESEEVQVKLNVADYVFNDNYKILSIEELETYIKENKVLPNIQTQKDVNENRGLVKIGELSISLMEKVEELTIHIIELNKRIKFLENKIETIK